MSEKRIGQIIKELRLLSGLSQESLAKDICSQAQISKLEGGYEIPYSNTLYEISKKLGVDMTYFFNYIETPQLDFVKQIKKSIRDNIRKKEYKQVTLIVKKYKNNTSFQSTIIQQFLIWHEAIAQYYLFPNQENDVLNKLNKALALTQTNDKYYKEREIEILTSIAAIYNACKLFEQSNQAYLKALRFLDLLPQVKNNQIKIKVLYGLSRNLYEKAEFIESQRYALEGIKLCINQETFYLLGELYYVAAYNLMKMRQSQQAMEYIQKSVFIFELTSNLNSLSILGNQLDVHNDICQIFCEEKQSII